MGDTVSSQSGGIDINAQQANIGGDVAGRDIIKQTVYQGDVPIALALHQLPPPPADFTGRTADLDAILNDIVHGALISGVRGMGGIGKTALALVIADRMKAQYQDAQFFIPLRGASESPVKPLDAMQSVIRAYHPTAQLPDDANQIANLYHSVLDNQRAIVLLDDARDTVQVLPLLPPASCLLLVTTRNTFAVPGLHARKLETLSPADARDLLVTIAPPTVRAVGERGEAGRGAVDEIARLCGYLPLALRAAASLIAATPDLNPLTYATQLRDERTRLTKIGKEGVDIDVEASLNLSYQQLSPEVARVFRQLSVFPATFDAAAAEAVCEDADHIHLSQLVRLSLVQYDETTGRYSLHDLARLFAASPLSQRERGDGGEGECATAQLRHAEHYKDVLAACKDLYKQGNENITRGLALFDLEWPNIQGGQAWAVMHLKDNDDVARLCNLYPDAGIYVLDLRLHSRHQIRWLEDALAAARQLKYREAEGVHLGNLGLAYADLGEMRKAIEYYEQRLVIAREIEDRRGEGRALGNLGVAYNNLSKTRQAIEFYEQALIIDREIGDRRGEANDLMNMGNAYVALGESRRAIEHHDQALPIFREIGDRRGEGNALGNLGNAYLTLGETLKAVEFYEQQRDIAREISDHRGEGIALGNLGIAYADLGETRKAIEFYEQRLVIAREIGDRRGDGNALGNLGNVYVGLGETRKAIEFYEQQLVIVREISDRRSEGNALWNMALVLDTLGERAQAIAHAEASLKIKEAIEDPHAEMVRRQLAKWKGSPSTDS